MALKLKFIEEKKESVRKTFDEMKERYEWTRDDLKQEDSDRALFTLEPARTNTIKYPTFLGSPNPQEG